MSNRLHVVLGLGVAALGAILVLGVIAFGRGSVSDHVSQRYRLVQRDGRSAVYSSPEAPSKVAGDIAKKWEPADRLSDPSGFFLRYRSDIVAVSPEPGGGSRIFVDDEDRGYARWYPVVGGNWGTYSGGGEGFRGGGPGAGK